jgi:hypothetical protein
MLDKNLKTADTYTLPNLLGFIHVVTNERPNEIYFSVNKDIPTAVLELNTGTTPDIVEFFVDIVKQYMNYEKSTTIKFLKNDDVLSEIYKFVNIAANLFEFYVSDIYYENDYRTVTITKRIHLKSFLGVAQYVVTKTRTNENNYIGWTHKEACLNILKGKAMGYLEDIKFELELMESLDNPYETSPPGGNVHGDVGTYKNAVTHEIEGARGTIFEFDNNGYWEIHHSDDTGLDIGKSIPSNHKPNPRWVATIANFAKNRVNEGKLVKIIGNTNKENNFKHSHFDTYHAIAKRLAKKEGFNISEPTKYYDKSLNLHLGAVVLSSPKHHP